MKQATPYFTFNINQPLTPFLCTYHPVCGTKTKKLFEYDDGPSIRNTADDGQTKTDCSWDSAKMAKWVKQFRRIKKKLMIISLHNDNAYYNVWIFIFVHYVIISLDISDLYC